VTSPAPPHAFTPVPRGPPSNPVASCLRLRSASRPRAPAAPHASLEASPTEATSTDRIAHASAIVARVGTQPSSSREAPPSSSREAPPSSTAPPSSIEFTRRRAVPVVDAFDVAGRHPPSISSRSHHHRFHLAATAAPPSTSSGVAASAASLPPPTSPGVAQIPLAGGGTPAAAGAGAQGGSRGTEP
jgi:hypothetical protein